jgi:pyruvate/2-oxoglutarate/acetoin dehydrogenase E1 component
MSTKLYQDEIKRAMNWIGEQDKAIIIGQSVAFAGTGCYDSLVEVPHDKKMELPVAENLQMGISIGLALNGFIPLSVYPRWNFLLCATDQIVNHLDKLPKINPACNPKVIIRVVVGSETPVDPQEQHKGNFSEPFRLMAKNLDIVELDSIESIMPAYKHAYEREDNKSTILVEFSDFGK